MLYHGTKKENEHNILENGFKIKIPNIYSVLYNDIKKQKIMFPGSLGYGLYTFVDSKENAKRFAEKFGGDSVVFGIECNVDRNKILDFTTETDRIAFINFVKNSKNSGLGRRIYGKFRDSVNFDLYAGIMTELFIQYAHTKGKEYVSVKKETETYFEGYRYRIGIFNGVEFTIRKKNYIKRYFRV